MIVGAALLGGFAGTLVLTTALTAASELRITRMDIPFLLGTAWIEDRTWARVLGYALHFLAGMVFALGYYAAFVVLGRGGWQLGMVFGLVHGLFAGTALVNVLLPAMHPRMGTSTSAANSTPIVTVLAHAAYGAIIGAFVAAASR
jgi:hypothetical protein